MKYGSPVLGLCFTSVVSCKIPSEGHKLLHFPWSRTPVVPHLPEQTRVLCPCAELVSNAALGKLGTVARSLLVQTCSLNQEKVSP